MRFSARKILLIIAVVLCAGVWLFVFESPTLFLQAQDQKSIPVDSAHSGDSIEVDDIVQYSRLIDEHNNQIQKIDRMAPSYIQKCAAPFVKPAEKPEGTVAVEKEIESFVLSHAKPLPKRDSSVSHATMHPDVSYDEMINVPFGRMLKCELVNSIDSINLETPIVGLVMEPLWIDDFNIIPAGTEVHGRAIAGKTTDRICSNKEWVLVFPKTNRSWNLKSIRLAGNALDREDLTGEGRTFGITDGSYGIKGHRIQSTQTDELKIFAAAFLEASLEGLRTTEPVGGIWPDVKLVPNGRNATLSGSAAVLDQYIQTLKKEIEEKGFYIRVPAGKQFYLYLTQEFDIARTDGYFSLYDTPKKATST